MPIREACHVAVQRSDPSKQKQWKHTQARQLANGGAVPVLQIVALCISCEPGEAVSSFIPEAVNRAKQQENTSDWRDFFSGKLVKDDEEQVTLPCFRELPKQSPLPYTVVPLMQQQRQRSMSNCQYQTSVSMHKRCESCNTANLAFQNMSKNGYINWLATHNSSTCTLLHKFKREWIMAMK
jgi:hypothetical protein